MFKDMKGVDKTEFAPGTVVFIDGTFPAFAVVFDRKVWAELAVNEFTETEIIDVLDNDGIIPLRVLGTVPYVDLNRPVSDEEPNNVIIRKYAVSNVGGDMRIIDNLAVLNEFLFLLRKLKISSHYFEEAVFDIKVLTDYFVSSFKTSTEECSYYRKLFALFQKGIPFT